MAPPVLFLVFNRPDTTRRVFEAIRDARPERLYVAADGPRADRVGEEEKCAEVRQIATAVDWPCEVQTLFRDRNLGCCGAVSGAITWFFKHEEEGIILEDDCVPSETFFRFCGELLDRYRYDNRVFSISGRNHFDKSGGVFDGYAFSRYNHIWGWATWRRAWQKYDHSLDSFDEKLSLSLLNQYFCDEEVAYVWTKRLSQVRAGQFHSSTWGYRWLWTCWINNSFIAIPSRNMIDNIGFGADATHTASEKGVATHCGKIANVRFPLIHADPDDWSPAYDQFVSREIHRIYAPIGIRGYLLRVFRLVRLRMNMASKNPE